MLHRCPRYCSDILSPRSRKQCRYSVYILLSLLFLLFLFLLLLLLLLFLLLFLLLLFLFLLLLLLILLFLLFLLLSLLSGLKAAQPLSPGPGQVKPCRTHAFDYVLRSLDLLTRLWSLWESSWYRTLSWRILLGILEGCRIRPCLFGIGV